MKHTKLLARPRNTIVLNPLMKKGGRHVCTQKNSRSVNKANLKRGVYE